MIFLKSKATFIYNSFGLNINPTAPHIKYVNKPKVKNTNSPGRKAPAAHPGTSLDQLL